MSSRTAAPRTRLDAAGRPRLLGETATLPGGGRSAPLRVPHGHPFFFDHPLDHVSGMVLLCAALDLVETDPAAPGDGWRLHTRLDFPALCELGRPVSVRATGDGAGPDGLRIDVRQEESTTCGGVLRWTPDTPPGGPAARRHDPTPCRPDLLHRARADNVLLGVPDEKDDAITWPVLRAPREHYLAGSDGGGHTTRSLVEAARQVTTMLFHHVGGRPADTQMIWLGLTADLPYVCRTDALALRWWRTRIRGSRFSVVLDLLHESTGRTLGGVTIDVTAVSAAAYRRFRQRAADGGAS
ncbi:AfsA-related hotdog domain-containing protein [Micromonospora sp. NPDC004551]|uniref:AfsA-related hotdog domain-containing protein n=1 Tax=Micromonospora sp. NPDC004551 TaxID=3154284 RepID=UPI0033BB080D